MKQTNRYLPILFSFMVLAAGSVFDPPRVFAQQGGDVEMSNNLAMQGSVYADTLAGGIPNEVSIKQAWPLFPPPPGVPQMETVIVRPGVWSEQEAIGL